MAMKLEHLQKNFVKTLKEPGLRGFALLYSSEKQTFEAVKDLTFRGIKGQILGFIGAGMVNRKSTTIKMLTEVSADIWFLSD